MMGGLTVLVLLMLSPAGKKDPSFDATTRKTSEKNGDRPGFFRPSLFAGVYKNSEKTIGYFPEGEIEEFVRFPWGSDKNSLGRTRPEEGNPEGPMAFRVTEKGDLVVLDQVNGRIQVYQHGQWVRSVPIPSDTYHDFALGADGRIAALDRFSRDEVVFISESGRTEGRIPLVGPEIPEGGLATGIFSLPDGTWVEVGHERLVRVADSQGRPLEDRSVMPGRPSADGRWLLQALREGPNAAVVLVRPVESPGGAPVLLARVEFPLPVLQLTALESDSTGRVYLAAAIARFDGSDPARVLEEYEPVVVLSPEGTELGRAVFPPRTLPEETLVPVRVAPDGTIYQMAFTESGVVFRRAVL